MHKPKTSAERMRTGSGGLAQRVLRFLQSQALTQAGDRLGVAVSGGADSVALLLLLLELREKLGVVLSVVHFNHKLRGKASDADEKFVAKLAGKHGLEFHHASLRVGEKARKERANLEEAARHARYDYFRSLAESGVLSHIAVAHTADDQAETVLAHILRGTGLTGLAGIHPVVGPVIRPLLEVRRGELRRFLGERRQDWREDATNLDVKRTRARIRLKLLPVLEKQFQKAIVEHLCNLAELAREDEAFLDAAARKRISSLVEIKEEETRIGLAGLLGPLEKKEAATEETERGFGGRDREAASSMSKRLVRELVARVKPHGGQLGIKHVEAVLELARGGQSGQSLSLPGGVEARRERDALVFYSLGKTSEGAKNGEPLEYEYKVELRENGAQVRVPELGCAFRFKVIDWPLERGETKERGAVLDRDRLGDLLVLRNWRAGDRLRPFGRAAAHKLKRLLNEKRVSRWKREGWPVVAKGRVLAWARGFPVAAEFAADEGTRRGIVITEEAL